MKHLQLYRNNILFNSRTEALNKWQDPTFKAALSDGEFIVARYKDGDQTYVMTGHYVASISQVVAHDFAKLEKDINTNAEALIAQATKIAENSSNIDVNTKEIETINNRLDIIEGGIDGDFTDLIRDIESISGEVATKQDKLTAGEGIAISGNTISCTLDTSLYSVVTTLPTTGEANKIYLVEAKTSGDTNVYIEYAYVNSTWEKLGEYKAEMDLTPYLTKQEANDTYLSQTEASSTYLAQGDASNTYLSKSNANDIYATKVALEESKLIFTNDDTNNVIFTKEGSTIKANIDTYDCGEY